MTCIYAFSVGGGQFLFLLGLIGSSLIYTSIPSFPYLVFGIIFLNQILNYQTTLIRKKITVLYCLLIYSAIVLFIKGIISALLALDKMPYDEVVLKTFGIPIKPKDFSAKDWLPTYFTEIGALICEIMLLVINYEVIIYSRREDEILSSEVPTSKDLIRHHQFWCYVSLIFTLFHSGGFPSFTSFIFLIVCIIVICFWFNHYKIEEAVYNVASLIIFWGSLLIIIGGYIIFIDAIYELRLSGDIIKLIGVPYLESYTDFGTIMNTLLLLMILLSTTIYRRLRKRIKKQSRIHSQRKRERMIRIYGYKMAEFADYDEDKAFQKLTERIEKRRFQKQRSNITDERLGGGGTKPRSRNSDKSGAGGDIQDILKIVKYAKQKEEAQKALQKQKQISWFEASRLTIMKYIYSASFSMHICRILMAVWIVLYTSVPSLVLLFILVHSMSYIHSKIFMTMLRYIYLPYVIILLLYHHLFNSVKSLLPHDFYDPPHNKYLLWNYDLKVYRYPFLEFALQIFTFYFFCITLHMRSEKKPKSEVPSKSNLLIQLLILFLNNMDKIICIITFFVGINTPDIYHMGLLIFFVFYILYPGCMKKTFFFFLLYNQLFVLCHYFYVVLRFYYTQGSNTDNWIKFVGIGTNYDGTAQYFVFLPDWSQWVLIFLSFLQIRVYKNDKSDEQMSQNEMEALTRNYLDSNPRCAKCLYITRRFFQIQSVWCAQIALLFIILLDHKSLAEVLSLLFLLIVIAIQFSGSYRRPLENERRIRRFWIVLLFYSTFYLLGISAFQLLFSKNVDFSEILKGLLDWLPEAVKSSAEIIGFYQIKGTLWKQLIGKLIFVLIVTYIWRYLQWLTNEEEKRQKSINRRKQQRNRRLNSDLHMQLVNESFLSDSLLFSQSQQEIRPQKEENIELKSYCAEKVNTQYFVYKCKPMWPVLDFMSNYFFDFLIFMVMILALEFRVAFIFFAYLIFISAYYIALANSLYKTNILSIEREKSLLLYSDIDMNNQFKDHTLIRVRHRSGFWCLLFMLTFLVLQLSYSSQFLYQMIENPAFASWKKNLEYTVWSSFWIGDTYEKQTVSNYWSMIWGYYFILVLLIFERKAQSWSYNRYGVDETYKIKKVRTTRQEQLERLKQEEQKNKVLRLSIHSKQSSFKENVMGTSKTNKLDIEKIQKDTEKQKYEKQQKGRYSVAMGKGFKTLVEYVLLYLILVGCVIKANFFSLVYFFAIVIILFCTEHSTRRMLQFVILVSILLVLQFGLVLSNLNNTVSPKPLPPSDWQPVNIPWYTLISKDPKKLADWAYFFSLGNEKIQVDGLWIQIVFLFLSGIYFHFFCEKYYELSEGQILHKSWSQMPTRTDLQEEQMSNLLARVGLEGIKGSRKLSVPREPIPDEPRLRGATLISQSQRRRERQDSDASELATRRSHSVKNPLKAPSSAFQQDQPEFKPRNSSSLSQRKIWLTNHQKEKIKKELVIRSWYQFCRTLVFFFMQFFTLCIILTLSVVNSGAISLVYTIFSLYYIYKARTFYENSETAIWSFPRLLKKVLLPYIQLDLLAQFIYQIPIPAFYEDSNKQDSATRIIGIFQLWFYDSEVKLLRFSDLMWYVALKAFIYAVIRIQIQVFDSNEYKEFVYTQLMQAKEDNKVRGTCMTYQFNNIRLTKECEISGNKHRIIQNLDLLRQRLYQWNKQYFHEKGFSGFKPPTHREAERYKEEARQRSHRGPSQTSYRLQNQSYQDIENDDDKVLKMAMKKAPFSVRLYIWAHKKLTNPLVEQKGEFLKRSQDKLYNGTLKALTEMEYLLIADFRSKAIYRREMVDYEEERMRIIEEEKDRTDFSQEQLQLLGIQEESRKQVPSSAAVGRRLSGIKEESEGGTVIGHDSGERIKNQQEAILKRRLNEVKQPVLEQSEYERQLKCQNMLHRYLVLFSSIVIAHTDAVCYLFMLVNHMVNADLLSFVFPAAILGYALIENPRPPQTFWKFILIYAEVVIFIKFALRFQIWELLRDDLVDFHDSYKIGIKFYFKVSEGQFFRNILMDTLTILAILSHQFALIRLGLWEKREPQQQNISEAIQRLLHKAEQSEDGLKTVRLALGVRGSEWKQNQLQRASSEILTPRHRTGDREPRGGGNFQDLLQDAEALQSQKRMVRFYSDSNLKELSNLPDWKVDEWHKEMEQIKRMKHGACTRFRLSITRSLFSTEYLKALFPEIKQQKPGYDFFAFMILPLFIVIIFTIFTYSKMAAQYLNFTLSLSYNQFSAGMVLCVIFQIFHIVLQRYFYLQQKSLVLSEKQTQAVNQEDGSESKISSARSQSMSGFRSASMRADSLTHTLQKRTSSIRASDDGPNKPTEPDEEGQYKYLEDRVTYIERDLPQLCKLLIHWLLIIVIHLMIFWVFPLNGNLTLQAHIWCDEGAGIPCNSFQANWSLIIIYLIYLMYFIFSAMQIRTGIPEIRDINAITNDDKPINKYIYKVYLAIPFLWELRTITDWTFTRTALDLFQWFKFQDIYNILFVTKVETKQYRGHKLGKPRVLLQKITMGCCMLFFLLLLIILPMIIFSGLNPIAQNNNVTGAETNLRLLFGGTNSYNIFTSSHTSSIQVMDDQTYHALNFNMEPLLRAFPRGQIQVVETNESSDNMLELTSANTEIIINKLNELTPQNILEKDFQIVMDYKFMRPEPAGSQAVEKHVPYQITSDKFELVDTFKRAFNQSQCIDQIVLSLPGFYIPTVRLTSNAKPKLIDVENLRRDIYLNQTCQVKTVYLQDSTVNQSVERFWSAGLNYTDSDKRISDHKGIVFYTVSDKVTSSLISYSVLTFYISIVLVIGNYLRGFFSGTAYKVILQEMPYPDDIILICEAIVSSRLEENFKREEELYYVLIEILRSPEMIKAITKSSLRKTD